MCGADQLEAWGWLEDRSTVSLVKLDPLAISSVMREKSLLKLVTLPRSLDSESKQHFINMSHRRAWVAPTNKGLPPSFNVPKAPVLSAPPQLNIVFRCIKQRHLQGKAGAIPKILQSHICCSDSVVLKQYSKGLNKAPFAPMKLTESDMKKHPDVTTTLRG